MEADLQARQAPAAKSVVIAHLARLANHFRSERPADSWTMLFEDYAEDLDGISEVHLREVIGKWRNEKPWFPKSNELRDRWHHVLHLEAEKLRRARVLLGIEQPKPWEAAA
jgi:hypothetical protein